MDSFCPPWANPRGFHVSFYFVLFFSFFPPCLVLDGAFDDTLKQRQPHVALGWKRGEEGNNRTIETTAIINDNNNSFSHLVQNPLLASTNRSSARFQPFIAQTGWALAAPLVKVPGSGRFRVQDKIWEANKRHWSLQLDPFIGSHIVSRVFFTSLGSTVPVSGRHERQLWGNLEKMEILSHSHNLTRSASGGNSSTSLGERGMWEVEGQMNEWMKKCMGPSGCLSVIRYHTRTPDYRPSSPIDGAFPTRIACTS